MQSKPLRNHLLYLFQRVRYADSFVDKSKRESELDAVLHALLVADVLTSVEFGILAQLSLNVSKFRFNELLSRAV